MEASNDFLDNLGAVQHEKLLREIWEDDLTPKNDNIWVKKDLFERKNPNQGDVVYDNELWNPNKASK